jgi:hypothetical protein
MHLANASLRKAMVSGAAIAAVLAFSSVPALANVVDLGNPGQDGNWGVVDLNNTTTLPAGTASFDAVIHTGSAATYRSPFDGSGGGAPAANWQTLNYFVIGPTGGNLPDPATLVLSSAAYVFSFLWGSIDAYNHVDFSLGSGPVTSVTGAQAQASGAGAIFTKGASLIQISGIGAFDTIRFYSDGQDAFELANITATVPLPSTLLLLGSGVFGLGFLARRKAKKSGAMNAAAA